MPRLIHAVPKYRKHRASGQAIVSIAGKDHYLGPHGTMASKALYDRLVAEYLAADRQQNVASESRGPAVVEVLAAFWMHCKSYYVKNGKPTKEQDAFRIIIRDIRRLYGDLPACEFGPKCLKAVRLQWIERDQSRQSVNKNMRRLTRIFKWAVSEELIPASVHQSLATVPGLKKGRCDVRDSPPVLPVSLEIVEATMATLPRTVAAMVRLQLLSGMRPGEICQLRPHDIDRLQDVWEYRPESHKTEHHERGRTVYLGPEAQAVLAPYLSRDPYSPCFAPQENMREHLAAKHQQRATPLSCGNRPGSNRKSKPKKQPGDRYDPNSYRQAVHRACDQAFPPREHFRRLEGETLIVWRSRLTETEMAELKNWRKANRWSPNQLRHTAATTIRKSFGLEAAQVILGHTAADVTQVYAERDAEKAREVARRIGKSAGCDCQREKRSGSRELAPNLNELPEIAFGRGMRQAARCDACRTAQVLHIAARYIRIKTNLAMPAPALRYS